MARYPKRGAAGVWALQAARRVPCTQSKNKGRARDDQKQVSHVRQSVALADLAFILPASVYLAPTNYLHFVFFFVFFNVLGIFEKWGSKRDEM